MFADDLYDQVKVAGRRRQGRDPDRFDFESEPLLYNDGQWHPLHAGQRRAWVSTKRHVAVIAGRRAGKTCLGPHWCLREIQRKGGGDGLVVGPTYPVMERRLIPECKAVWGSMGEYRVARKCFEFNTAGCKKLGVDSATAWFGFAEDPESLESMRAKWCWRDETGQTKFSREAAGAIEGRIAQDQGRILDTTTPYAFNWFKTDVWDQQGKDPGLDVVSFLSKDNPCFPLEEWERLREKMPDWQFAMMYEGRYTRPAGAVVDCFDRKQHVVPAFEVPNHWRRLYGVDFGSVHTFVACAAEHPEEKDDEGYPVLYFYHEHFPNQSTATWQHVKALQKMEPDGCFPNRAVGGSRSERDWRAEWTNAGLPVEEPWVRDVQTRIDRSYAAFQRGGVKIMDCCSTMIQQVESYAWELDDGGEPIPGKLHDQNSFHGVDAPFYLLAQVRPGKLSEPKTFRTSWFGDAMKEEGLEGDWDR